MTLFLKYNFDLVCKTLIKEKFEILNISFTLGRMGEIHLDETLSEDKLNTLSASLKRYGIDIITNPKTTLVERIKNTIDQFLRDKELHVVNFSTYLSDELRYSYSYLSTVFSENTYTSIENYIILKKVDLAKELICSTNLTLTEISYKLNYSSVAHLSGQFKKTTGLTPSTFQRIMKNKKTYTNKGN